MSFFKWDFGSFLDQEFIGFENYRTVLSDENFRIAFTNNTVINDDMKRTLPIAISGFFGQHQFTQWGYVFALSVLSLIPILVVFVSCQRFFVQGLTAGSVKG